MSLLLIRIDLVTGGEEFAVYGYTVGDDGGGSEIRHAEDVLVRDPATFQQVRDAVLSVGDAELSTGAAGTILWNFLMGGNVGRWWLETTEGSPPDVELRTLLDVRADDLKPMPWELMAPPGRAPVFRSDARPWVRPRKTPLPPTDEFLVPLKVLVIVGSTEDDLEIDEELAAVHGALRTVPCRWHIETRIDPTRTQLRKAFTDVEPHIVHFIAHGIQQGGAPVLAMRRGLPGQWALSAADIDELHRPAPRLIILDACRTADPADGQEAAWEFTTAFFKAGAAAVIAMQGDITSAAAAVFAESLYTDLAERRAIDVAVARARRAVYDAADGDSEVSDRCWALPRLTVDCHPKNVLPVRAAVDDFDRPPFSVAFEQVVHYVDRATERRDLWTTLDPGLESPAPGLVVVPGAAQVGKSAVILSTLMTLRLQGRHVVYVDFNAHVKGDDRAGWLRTLLLIREQIWEWNPDVPTEPRRLFDHNLSYLKSQQDPPPLPANSPTPPPTDDFPHAERNHEAYVKRTFAAFREMLSTAMDGKPVLLVLDNSRSKISVTDVQDWLTPQLLEPVAKEQVANVRVALVGTDEELQKFGGVATAARRAPTLEPFKKDEVNRLAREFYARKGIRIARDGWWSPLRELFSKSPRDSWGAGELAIMLKFAAGQS